MDSQRYLPLDLGARVLSRDNDTSRRFQIPCTASLDTTPRSDTSEEDELVGGGDSCVACCEENEDDDRYVREEFLNLARQSHRNLPDWACERCLREIYDQNPCMSLSAVAGPAMVLVQVATILLWLSYPSLVLLSMGTSTCSDGDAVYPIWLWATFLPVMLSCLFLEYHMLKYATLRFVGYCGAFRLCEVEVPVKCWFAICLCLSALNFADMATDSFFVGQVMKAGTCKGQLISAVWAATMKQSTLLWLADVPFSHIVIMVWLLTFLQILGPVLSSTRRLRSPEVDYTIAYHEFEGHWKFPPGKEIHNVLGGKISLGNSLRLLAQANGMFSFLAMEIPSSAEMLKYQFVNHSDNALFIANYLHKLVADFTYRFATTFFLEKILQAHLQISAYAMKRALMASGAKDLQLPALMSIMMTLATTVPPLLDAWRIHSIALDSLRRLSYLQSSEVNGVCRGIKYWYAALIAMVLAVCVLLLYCWAKLVAAFVCPDPLVNLSGCVDLSHVLPAQNISA